MKQIVRSVKIIGTGSYVPERIVSNRELEQRVPTTDAWIWENLGIRERRVAAEGQATSDLAARAGMRAIENAGLAPENIDLIIVATATPDRLAPSTACFVQDLLKAYHAVCFDLAAVCSGFMFALSTAAQYIAANVYDRVLVIGADTFSKITDWDNRQCVFFGDGAGAAVLSHAHDGEGFLAFRLYSDGRGRMNFTVPGGGSEHPLRPHNINEGLQYFFMNGRAVYKTAIEVLPQAINQVLADTGILIEDVDYLIPHQPSIQILKETAKRIGLPFDRVLTNMDRYANTSGGTVPILLDEVRRKGLLTPGKLVLFAAVGAGWTWGASLIKWS